MVVEQLTSTKSLLKIKAPAILNNVFLLLRGARHGIRMNGKLQRIQEQEERIVSSSSSENLLEQNLEKKKKKKRKTNDTDE